VNVPSLLVANRGEIAIRVLRAASELGMRTVAVHPADDSSCLHIRHADEARRLDGFGASAYMDARQIVAVAKDSGCEYIHPGYGFLAENASFARMVADAGLRFVGPQPEVLELFGDKGRARDLASACGVPVLPGTSAPTSIDDARSLLTEHGALMIKAVAGGGGRGMRAVRRPAELDAAYERCRSEAKQAFGNPDIYVERLVEFGRHVEVQVLGDGSGVRHLWERECSLQRRHQKLVEVAPAPGLDPVMRASLLESAVRMAQQVRLESLATFEFLVWDGRFAFIEANPRLQVEHTVTEEVTGADLVRAQLTLAAGRSLDDLELPDREPSGFALQVRVNAETMGPDGSVRPSMGTITAFELPSGPGVRVDTCGYAGYTISPSYDSLLAKVVARSGDLPGALARAYRALCELRIEGVVTNVGFLQSLLREPAVLAGRWHTGLVSELAPALAAGGHPHLYAEESTLGRLAGVKVDPTDPLAVLVHGKTGTASAVPAPSAEAVEGAVAAPVQGTIVSIDVDEGELVRAGRQLLVMEAMKMEHVVLAPLSGFVQRITVAVGDTVYEGHPLVLLEAAEADEAQEAASDRPDLDEIRPDLAEVLAMHDATKDANRPQAVERRRATGQRTARRNVEDLCDPGTFVEYAPLVVAGPAGGRSLRELLERTASDGLVCGMGSVNGSLFGTEASRCLIAAYDYTVLAGTQGAYNHRKKDRIFELAEKMRLPLILFSEGGGGRAGTGRSGGATPSSTESGSNPQPNLFGMGGILDPMAFHLFGRLSGLVPLVGINSGFCFAGNAALLGCCDVVVATENSSIGMGGPAMIEGGGLGVYRPEEVGPIGVQSSNGVVDVAVADEAEAVAVAKRYLSYFQGSIADWECADQRLLRSVIPENRLRVYDVRRVIETLADSGSVLELRPAFGLGMVTALARFQGRPVGIIANNPMHLAGAVDSPGADKASRFMQLCDAFDLPILFLCDTPGIMVGPEVEKTAVVRHAARMFVAGASLSVPFFTIVLRKAYGLGAMTMAGGSFKVPLFVVSWPTGEFGGMGLEGQVKLGARERLAAIEDPAERKEVFERMVARLYESGKALNTAVGFGFDDVIDPADSRRWITAALQSVPPPPARRERKKRPFVDTW
jgi:acetyl/propionyl-CoA carboxylase alpha subunit